MHLKKTSKLVKFCVAILTLKMEEDTQSFGCSMLCYFKKGKNKTGMQQKDCAGVWRRCCDWSNMSEVVCKVSWYYWHFVQIILCSGAVLYIGRCLAAPLASTHQKPIVGDSWHTKNIQVNKVMGENDKCVFYFMEKTKRTFWPTQYSIPHVNWR